MPNREQRNPYKGNPPNPWVTVRFEKADGTGSVEKQLAVDTGDPSEARISSQNMRELKLADGPNVETNYGHAAGGWVYINMPELGLEKWTLVFATDQLVSVVKRISQDFDGQVGLEFLRELEFGGNDREFWIRPLGHDRRTGS